MKKLLQNKPLVFGVSYVLVIALLYTVIYMILDLEGPPVKDINHDKAVAHTGYMELKYMDDIYSYFEELEDDEKPKELYLYYINPEALSYEYDIDNFMVLTEDEDKSKFFRAVITDEELYKQKISNEQVSFMIKYIDGKEVARWIAIP